MVAFTNPMYKKSCELTEDNNNNVDNIVIVKHWEGRLGFWGQFHFFLFVQLDSSIGYATLKNEGGREVYSSLILGQKIEP